MADQFTRGGYNTVRGMNVRYQSWPVLGGAGVGGITLTSGAGAWGAYADVIAAAAIATEFWFCGQNTYTSSVLGNYQFQWQNTTLTSTLAAFSVDVALVDVNVPPIWLPIPVYCAGSSQIQARVGMTAAKTVVVAALYATGL